MKRIKSKIDRLATSLVGCLLLTSANTGAAASVLDQFSPGHQSVFGGAPTENWQQGVTAGMSGTLSSISLYSYGGPTTFKVYINLGSPWQSDANAFEVQVTRPWGSEWFSIDVSAANIQLTSGTRYIIGADGQSLLWGNDNAYSRGALWGKLGDTPPETGPYGDLAFATYMTPVPEPTTLALSMIALAMLVRRQCRICADRA